MKRFQLLTTAIFLFCTLLIAGCTGRGVEAQTTPAPEATPTATTNIQAGIQTGDNEVNKILAGTWAFERTDAERRRRATTPSSSFCPKRTPVRKRPPRSKSPARSAS